MAELNDSEKRFLVRGLVKEIASCDGAWGITAHALGAEVAEKLGLTELLREAAGEYASKIRLIRERDGQNRGL